MACDTFIKIANKCKRHFVALQPGESEAFIEEIVRGMSKITCDLSPQQVHTFYEACGYMISAQGQKSVQERLIQELMSIPNSAVSCSIFGLWCQLTVGAVGPNHLDSQCRQQLLGEPRDHPGHWKHHEDQCSSVLFNRKLLLPANRSHFHGHAAHVPCRKPDDLDIGPAAG